MGRRVLELWGGPECTVNRVGDAFRDQARLTGHHDRPEDLAAFAALGIKTLRYPVLWERIAPDTPDERDWTWTDARLAEIGRLGMSPIAGLLHHGSGPAYTSLVADDFVPLFVDHATAVAHRYPWITDWTPVNEPLTTARFGTLYGFWYPHARDERAFWTALFNQIEATQGAMAAIRRVNPAARLVQTEDLGYYYSTPELTDVATYYNERRWLTWDLLTGHVTPGHKLWSEIDAFGLGDRARAIADAPCPPDIVGVNHYVTSERFLDHRIDAYPFPPAAEGYHDLTAARILHPPPRGLADLLRQASDRYGLPLAVTESHLGCTRDEQMRWLWQSWNACLGLEAEGVDIRALTAWALVGNVDWSSLITIEAGDYEPGAFDASGEHPRATAIARLLSALGGDAEAMAWCRAHPVLAGQGWWQRDIRLEHPPFLWKTGGAKPNPPAECRPILITGATGTLGQAFAGGCDLRGLTYVLTDRNLMAIEDPTQVGRVLDLLKPWAVVNTAGWVRVDDAEDEIDGCLRANTEGAVVVAEACATRGIHYTVFSSDLVFDGTAEGGYAEDAAPHPLNVYGQSKAQAEARILALQSRALIVRTAAFFSPYDPHNFAMHVETALTRGEPVLASADHVITPTYVPDLVNACLDLIIDDEAGLWHLTSGEPVSWLEFGRGIADALGLDAELIRAASPEQLGWRAPRPRDVSLISTRGALLPPLHNALARHAATRRGHLAARESEPNTAHEDPTPKLAVGLRQEPKSSGEALLDRDVYLAA